MHSNQQLICSGARASLCGQYWGWGPGELSLEGSAPEELHPENSVWENSAGVQKQSQLSLPVTTST